MKRPVATARWAAIASIVGLVVAVAPPASAGRSRWTTGGPEGGTVASFAVDPSHPGTVYAGGDGGVAVSVDGGSTWRRTGLTGLAVDSVAVAASDPNTLYAAAHFGPVYVTTDGGRTWAPTTFPDFAQAVAVDPTDPSTVYAGGIDGVYVSTDGGATWTKGGTGPRSVAGLAVDPTSQSTVWAMSTGTSFVWVSTDSGATWTEREPIIESQSVASIVVAPTSPSTVFVGIRSGVFQSNDLGVTWTKGTNGGQGIVGLATDPARPATVFAVSTDTTLFGRVLETDDAGSSWRVLNPGGEFNITPIAAVPGSPGILLAGAGVSSVEDPEGVLRSTDGGATWSPSHAGFDQMPIGGGLAIDPQHPSTLYAWDGFGGLQKSTDGGRSWSFLGQTQIDGFAIDPVDPSVLYASIGIGISRSDDGGLTWGPPAGLEVALELVVDPVDDGTVYAGTTRGLAKSTDRGERWKRMNVGIGKVTNVWAVALAPSSPNTLYASLGTDFTVSKGVYVSTDGAATWTRADTGLPSFTVTTLVVDPTDAQRVWALTGVGVYRTIDGGSTWSQVGADVLTGPTALAGDPAHPDVLYAAEYPFTATAQTVYVSQDGGDTWAPFTAPKVTDFNVSFLAVDPSGRTIHAATRNAGVWDFST